MILTDLLKDRTGAISHSRLISLGVGFSATIFMWKLILVGGMTYHYFALYLLYGTGHQTINKFLDLLAHKADKNGTNP